MNTGKTIQSLSTRTVGQNLHLCDLQSYIGDIFFRLLLHFVSRKLFFIFEFYFIFVALVAFGTIVGLGFNVSVMSANSEDAIFLHVSEKVVTLQFQQTQIHRADFLF